MTASRKARRTRAELIQAAAENFAERGYHATSYAEMVSASGMSKGAFYFHFSSKQELALEVYRTKHQEVLAALAAATGGATSPLEGLIRTIEHRAVIFHEDRSLRCLPRLSTDFSRDPSLRRLVADLHAGALRPITAMLEDAQRAGELRPELEAPAVARTIFASLIGLDELSERESGGSDLIERTEAFVLMLRFALTAERPNESPGNHNERV